MKARVIALQEIGDDKKPLCRVTIQMDVFLPMRHCMTDFYRDNKSFEIQKIVFDNVVFE